MPLDLNLEKDFNYHIPKISVIMPCYNPDKKWLREAVESILNQTYKDFEFIILDDGSTNNIEEVINEYKHSEMGSKIKYIKLPHRGISETLNTGFDEAQGEYIARMDADDISLPDRFKIQVEFLDNNLEYSVVGSSIEIFGTGNYIWNYPQTPKYFDFLKGCFIAHPVVMLRKKDFDKYNLRYKSDIACEDYELWSRAIRYVKFYNLPISLLKYRLHGDNISLKPEIYAATKAVQDSMLNFLTDKDEIKNEIKEMIKDPDKMFWHKYKFSEKIFSLKKFHSSNNKVYIILYILGIKITKQVKS